MRSVTVSIVLSTIGYSVSEFVLLMMKVWVGNFCWEFLVIEANVDSCFLAFVVCCIDW